jgi:hypothetical protein
VNAFNHRIGSDDVEPATGRLDDRSVVTNSDYDPGWSRWHPRSDTF